MSPSFGLRAAAASDVGPHRSVNQDAAFTAAWAAAVADGVGGGPAGDIASSVFVHRLVAGARGPVDVEQLATLLRIANWDLRALVERDPSLDGMATTFTGLFVSPAGILLLAHTGDSRAYLLRDGAMSRETRDDSFVQLLIDSGVVQPADAAFHPHRNVITASLRGAEDDRIALIERPARAGDRWMLCSDGLSDYVPDQEIIGLLAVGDAQAAADSIVALALAAGTRDNVTVVVADIVDDPEWAHRPAFYGSASGRFIESLDEGLESA
ncbi:serine/threonine-protein phosphatase [Microbacterium sp. 4R-513]|nr:protein phosphatase 2C domain-containing protein [Microbacterium sp. 4R-513]QIG41330.1 serine/threonine-protein phosphatase [Microbacterium sp. 4R-513]